MFLGPFYFLIWVPGQRLQDWSPVTGNPVKFGLGSVSMLFDVIFMVQHYVLYPEAEGKVQLVVGREEGECAERQPLASNASQSDG